MRFLGALLVEPPKFYRWFAWYPVFLSDTREYAWREYVTVWPWSARRFRYTTDRTVGAS